MDGTRDRERWIVLVMEIVILMTSVTEIILGGVNFEACPKDYKVAAFVVTQGGLMTVNSLGVTVWTELFKSKKEKVMATFKRLMLIAHLACIVYGVASIAQCPCKDSEIFRCAFGFMIVMGIFVVLKCFHQVYKARHGEMS